MGTEKLPPITLRYNGLFDFDGLYAAIIDWAKNYGYMWHEKTYKHKVPSPQGAEQEFAWEMIKEVTEFIKYTITITTHAWEMKEVEAENGGVKKPLTNARIYLILSSKLEYDWQGRFKGSKFAQFLGKWYVKLWSKNLESVYIDQLYYRTWNLHALIKQFFDMQTKKYAYKGYLGES